MACRRMTLFEASGYDIPRVVNQLLQQVEDPNAEPCLYHACEGQHYEVARLLLANGANAEVTVCNNRGIQTALHFACVPSGDAYTKLEFVKLLVEHGAFLDAQDVCGKTPLHIACHRGDAAVVQYLLEQGAKRSLRNNKGESTLELAKNQENYSQLVAWFQRCASEQIGRFKVFQQTILHAFVSEKSPFYTLAQGTETSAGIKQHIAEYLGIPICNKMAELRDELEVLNRLLPMQEPKER